MLPALLLAFLLAVQDKPPETCALSGAVVDSTTGVALNKVHIVVEPPGNAEGPLAVTDTDAKGNFTMAGIDPGKYRIKAIRNGYLDTYYGSRRGDGAGTVVSLETGQEIKDLQVKLLPFAVIAGTIRDPEGEPVEGAAVVVRRLIYQDGQRDLEGREEILTDDLGQYRAAGLTPGRYIVEARPKDLFDSLHPPVDHSLGSRRIEVLLPAIYPGVQDRVSAKPVEVAAGARVTGIDITLARGRMYTISGRVTLPAGVAGQIDIDPPDSWNPIAFVRNVKGDFEIRGIPPGSYVLHGWVETPAQGTAAARDYSAEIPLTLEGADIAGLKVTFEPNPEIAGHVTVEGEKPIALHHGRVISLGNGNPGVDIDAGNNFVMQSRPGHQVVGVTGDELQNDLIVKSIRMEQTDVLREGLTLAAGANAHLEIVLAPDGARIDGSVLDKDEKPVAGATLVAIPEPGLRVRPDRYYQASTDQHGRYELKNLAPGAYKILAWDDVEPGAWFDPDFLRDVEAQALAVTLGVQGQETVTVHLTAQR